MADEKTTKIAQVLDELLDDKFSDSEAKDAFDKAGNAYFARRQSLRTPGNTATPTTLQRLALFEQRLAAVETALGITPQ